MIVVIPYFNNPTDFAVLLMQLQSQRVKPDSIYIADNSKDGSGFEIVQRYQYSVPIYVEKKAGPIYESWNKGIDFAKQDVIIINDDVMISWDFIEIYKTFMESGEADVYCPAIPGFPPTKHIRKYYSFYPREEISAYLLEKQMYEYAPNITGWCMGIPWKTIEKLGKFDLRFKCWYGDKDYEARIFNAGGKLMFIKGLNVSHFGTSSYGKLKKKVYEKMYKQDQITYEQKYGMVHKEMKA